jgi:hypothetical protein
MAEPFALDDFDRPLAWRQAGAFFDVNDIQ